MYPAKPNHHAERLKPTATKSLSTRLEQHQQELNRLRLQLNTCATRSKKENSTLEQIDSLKRSIETLSFDNLKILASLRDHKESRGDYLERVATQFSEFHKLRRGVKEYVQGVESARRGKQNPVLESIQFFGTVQSESSRLWSKFSTSMNAFFF